MKEHYERNGQYCILPDSPEEEKEIREDMDRRGIPYTVELSDMPIQPWFGKMFLKFSQKPK